MEKRRQADDQGQPPAREGRSDRASCHGHQQWMRHIRAIARRRGVNQRRTLMPIRLPGCWLGAKRFAGLPGGVCFPCASDKLPVCDRRKPSPGTPIKGARPACPHFLTHPASRPGASLRQSFRNEGAAVRAVMTPPGAAPCRFYGLVRFVPGWHTMRHRGGDCRGSTTQYPNVEKLRPGRPSRHVGAIHSGHLAVSVVGVRE